MSTSSSSVTKKKIIIINQMMSTPRKSDDEQNCIVELDSPSSNITMKSSDMEDDLLTGVDLSQDSYYSSATDANIEPNQELKAYTNNSKLYLPWEVFFRMLQDSGTKSSNKQAARKIITYNDYQYKEIYSLSKKLIELYHDKNNGFILGNISATSLYGRVHVLGRWILKNRKIVQTTEITPEMRKIVGPDNDTVYFLDQKILIQITYHNWIYSFCTQPTKSTSKFGVNIRARLFGLLFHQNHREQSIMYLFYPRRDKRAVLDDKTVSKKSIFSDIHQEFQDKNVKVQHPQNWENLLSKMKSKHSTQSKLYQNFEIIDPNHESIFNGESSPSMLIKVFDDTKAIYKETMRKWTMGTGGGSGAPEDFCYWEKRDPEYFNGYSNKLGGLLTWIFLYDKYFHYPMRSQLDVLTCGNETAFSQLSDEDDDDDTDLTSHSNYSKKNLLIVEWKHYPISLESI